MIQGDVDLPILRLFRAKIQEQRRNRLVNSPKQFTTTPTTQSHPVTPFFGAGSRFRRFPKNSLSAALYSVLCCLINFNHPSSNSTRLFLIVKTIVSIVIEFSRRIIDCLQKTMHRVRIVLSTKPLWMSTLTVKESNSHCGITRLPTLLAPSFHLSLQPVRRVHLDAPLLATAARQLEPNFFSRIWSKIGLPDAGKYRRKMTGYLLYEDIVKKITYMHFFEDLKMADTFYSWFVITELHVWMLMLRYMAEGKNGQEMRNNIVEAMWTDVNTRKSKLEKANVIALKKQISDLSSQFNAAVIGYDEGIMSDDKVLAAALWRRCFQCECSNPESVEKLVHYVRKQVNELDHLPKQDIMKIRSISWLDYKSF